MVNMHLMNDISKDVFRIKATVKLRRGKGWDVRPEAEQIDGLTHTFRRGWTMTEEDTSIYVGETTWIADREGWPKDGCVWTASGDLVDIVEKEHP